SRDADLERGDFLVQATEQLNKFLKANRERISELGGLTLIDDDPDYLSIAADLTFRSRTRYLDDLTNEWRSETEVIERQAEPVEVDDDELAAQRLYDLALEYQERSQRSESRLLEQFEDASSSLISKIGDLIVNDDDDERLTLTASGEFRAEVLTEEDNEWRPLTTADELVEYYDPTDVFGDLADALAEAFPTIAPEVAAFEAAPVTPDGASDAATTNGDDATTAGDADGDGDGDDDTDEDAGNGTGEDSARR